MAKKKMTKAQIKAMHAKQGQTARGKAQDLRQTAKNTLPPTRKNMAKWKLNPGKMDISEIDTKMDVMSLYEFKRNSSTEKQKDTGWTSVIYPGGVMVTDVKRNAKEDIYYTLKHKGMLKKV